MSSLPIQAGNLGQQKFHTDQVAPNGSDATQAAARDGVLNLHAAAPHGESTIDILESAHKKPGPGGPGGPGGPHGLEAQDLSKTDKPTLPDEPCTWETPPAQLAAAKSSQDSGTHSINSWLQPSVAAELTTLLRQVALLKQKIAQHEDQAILHSMESVISSLEVRQQTIQALNDVEKEQAKAQIAAACASIAAASLTLGALIGVPLAVKKAKEEVRMVDPKKEEGAAAEEGGDLKKVEIGSDRPAVEEEKVDRIEIEPEAASDSRIDIRPAAREVTVSSSSAPASSSAEGAGKKAGSGKASFDSKMGAMSSEQLKEAATERERKIKTWTEGFKAASEIVRNSGELAKGVVHLQQMDKKTQAEQQKAWLDAMSQLNQTYSGQINSDRQQIDRQFDDSLSVIKQMMNQEVQNLAALLGVH